MSLLYLHFESDERAARVQKIARSGAHIVVSEPKWPGFYEIAKREKPTAVAVDFTHAPSHALETADYLAKAKETREAALFLLRVPEDRLDLVRKRLPQAEIVTEQALALRLAEQEREAAKRALEKKEAAAQARRAAKAAKAAIASVRKGTAPAPEKPAKKAKAASASPRRAAGTKKVSPAPGKSGKKSASKKKAARPPKKK